MSRRSEFIGELERDAKRQGLKFRTSTRRGKGSHMMLWVGDNKVAIVPSREIDPVTAQKIRKQLGLD